MNTSIFVCRILATGKIQKIPSEKTGGTGAARHFPANYMPFAVADIFVCEHVCVRAKFFGGNIMIFGAEF